MYEQTSNLMLMSVVLAPEPYPLEDAPTSPALAPAISPPPGVRVLVKRWERWWECRWKSETLCLPEGKGPVLQREPIWVEGMELSADAFADQLKALGYKCVGVGCPEEGE